MMEGPATTPLNHNDVQVRHKEVGKISLGVSSAPHLKAENDPVKYSEEDPAPGSSSWCSCLHIRHLSGGSPAAVPGRQSGVQ
jgi:hypothetical protein